MFRCTRALALADSIFILINRCPTQDAHSFARQAHLQTSLVPIKERTVGMAKSGSPSIICKLKKVSKGLSFRTGCAKIFQSNPESPCHLDRPLRGGMQHLLAHRAC